MPGQEVWKALLVVCISCSKCVSACHTALHAEPVLSASLQSIPGSSPAQVLTSCPWQKGDDQVWLESISATQTAVSAGLAALG